MNDLELIRLLRSEVAETDPDALTGARGRLLAVMARTAAPRRSRRPLTVRVTGLAATAVALAAAVAVMIATGQTAAPVKPLPYVREALPLTSAKNILLVAAANAEHEPQGSGTYWHIRRESEDGRPRGESWTTRDGRQWSRGMPGRGEGVVKEPSASFWLGLGPGGEVGFQDLQALPTDPETLKQRVVKTQTDTVGELDIAFLPLVSLIAELPAPAEVRAAAFRALASLPNVQRLGAADGGEELMIPDGTWEIKLVVDPKTSRVIRTNLLPTASGGLAGANRGFIKLTTGWTDELPR
ncbi:CU044_5270 family protein [Nonomuraea sp. NPDC052116]|uniref:CU044_5270 family protein n=1 Tax=Nonomuraea sp. NPDC052116 TaxID=3155665 RepID=UPI00341BFEE4